MKMHHTLIAAALSASAFLAGCAAPGYPSASSQPQPYPAPSSSQGYYSSYGVVDSIQLVNTSGSSGGIGAGAVIGGVVGGLLGNQVGGGTGRTVATAAGAVGGAVVGNQIEQRNKAPASAYQIGVRLDNGTYQTIMQESVADLSVGSRVRIENGRAFRY
jgi:outer membrane lipoprotein SlyB